MVQGIWQAVLAIVFAVEDMGVRHRRSSRVGPVR